jgi:hypothetical protein
LSGKLDHLRLVDGPQPADLVRPQLAEADLAPTILSFGVSLVRNRELVDDKIAYIPLSYRSIEIKEQGEFQSVIPGAEVRPSVVPHIRVAA